MTPGGGGGLKNTTLSYFHAVGSIVSITVAGQHACLQYPSPCLHISQLGILQMDNPKVLYHQKSDSSTAVRQITASTQLSVFQAKVCSKKAPFSCQTTSGWDLTTTCLTARWGPEAGDAAASRDSRTSPTRQKSPSPLEEDAQEEERARLAVQASQKAKRGSRSSSVSPEWDEQVENAKKNQAGRSLLGRLGAGSGSLGREGEGRESCSRPSGRGDREGSTGGRGRSRGEDRDRRSADRRERSRERERRHLSRDKRERSQRKERRNRSAEGGGKPQGRGGGDREGGRRHQQHLVGPESDKGAHREGRDCHPSSERLHGREHRVDGEELHRRRSGSKGKSPSRRERTTDGKDRHRSRAYRDGSPEKVGFFSLHCFCLARVPTSMQIGMMSPLALLPKRLGSVSVLLLKPPSSTIMHHGGIRRLGSSSGMWTW